MRIQNSNTNASLGTLGGGDFTGFETDDNHHQISDMLLVSADSQHLPHYYATFATGDKGDTSSSTLKSKDGKSRRRKPISHFPRWMYEVFYLSSDFLPENLFTSKVWYLHNLLEISSVTIGKLLRTIHILYSSAVRINELLQINRNFCFFFKKRCLQSSLLKLYL